MQDARSAGTGVYMDVHEDSEHRATQQIIRATIISAFPYSAASTASPISFVPTLVVPAS